MQRHMVVRCSRWLDGTKGGKGMGGEAAPNGAREDGSRQKIGGLYSHYGLAVLVLV